MDTREQWLRLALTPGLGPATIKKLLLCFGSVENITQAGADSLAQCGFLRQESLVALSALAPAIARAVEDDLRLAEKNGVTILCWDDPLYPPLLREIHDPPVLLYVKGDPGLLSSPGLAMVGARAATSYGRQVAGLLAAGLAHRELTIVSGFALGIDTAAHHGALGAGGSTIAVMGCGLDIVYPAQNGKLFEEIASSGALISEYPFATLPESFRFPARNRIISGLSLGVVVVEAAKRSGTLITARQALEQGREVFAVPGRIDSPKSEGCHRLIQEGAKLVHTVDDILEELALNKERPTLPAAPTARPALTSEEEALFSLLDAYPKNIEQIIAAADLPAHRAQEILLHLELLGLVAALPGNQYQRVAEPCWSGV